MRVTWILILLALAGCDPRMPNAVGDRNRIVVFADAGEWEEWGPELARIFVREVNTPRRELVFNIQQVAHTSWDFFQRYRNIVLCAPLDGEGSTSVRIRGLMSPRAQQQVREREEGVHITLRDPYARGQILVVVTADTGERLREYLERSRETLYAIMEEELNARIRDGMYEFEERYALEDSLLQRFGFVVRVPFDFRLNDDHAQERFVRMIRYGPERWFFAYWIPPDAFEEDGAAWVEGITPMGMRMEMGTDPSTEEMDLLARRAMDLRDGICDRYYDGDRINRQETTATLVRMGTRWAVRLTGLWGNRARVIGGPLVSYFFWDPVSEMAWWVDGAVYAPNAEKETWLRQMDVMLNTFRTGEEALAYVASIQELIDAPRRR